MSKFRMSEPNDKKKQLNHVGRDTRSSLVFRFTIARRTVRQGGAGLKGCRSYPLGFMTTSVLVLHLTRRTINIVASVRNHSFFYSRHK